MNARTVLALLSLGALLLLGGCPDGGSTGNGTSVPEDLVVSASGPETVVSGDAVVLGVSLSADAGAVTYEWFQTSGPKAGLSVDADGTARLTAPTVTRQQRIAFRVDVRGLSGILGSAVVGVTIDPPTVDDNGSDDGSGDGGDGSGGDGSGGDGSGDGDGSGGGSTGDGKLIRVEMKTSKGDIVMDLYVDKAPKTVENFLEYVDDKFFDNTIFHRVVPDFVIQGGGFTSGMVQKETNPPIKNESTNGLKNNRGTVAMARTSDVSSATSQFFINLKDNDDLNYESASSPGYCVFGVVVTGMDVVDEIAAVATEGRDGGHQNVPVEDVVITSIRRTLNPGGR